jgi:hypothetical protein
MTLADAFLLSMFDREVKDKRKFDAPAGNRAVPFRLGLTCFLQIDIPSTAI